MLKRTRNGGALTQQLLAFSRRQSLEPEKVDLNQHIGSLTALLERTLGRDIRIERHLDPALGPVLIDANQLDVAILNLAVNARHAMTDYGRFTIETSDAPDDLDDLKGLAASFVRLTLSDTGHGMDKQVLAQVFEPFFTTKSNGEGTGLGLSQATASSNSPAGTSASIARWAKGPACICSCRAHPVAIHGHADGSIVLADRHATDTLIAHDPRDFLHRRIGGVPAHFPRHRFIYQHGRLHVARSHRGRGRLQHKKGSGIAVDSTAREVPNITMHPDDAVTDQLFRRLVSEKIAERRQARSLAVRRELAFLAFSS
ncbi:ATP-binding protein [Mesorhizobium sp. M0012]